ncbi:MAG: ATP-grasp domain-containing protein [Pseudomonas sp.]
MHVLILGARAPACLEWARAFAASGWTVSVGDSLAWPLARSSRAVDHFVRLPEPRSNPQAWIEALAGRVRQDGIELIVPTCEEAFYLAHGLAQLAPLCRVLTSDFELLHRLHHKGRFAEMTRGWPLEAPETRLLQSREDCLALIAEHGDWVFKPAYSRFASRTLIRPHARAVEALRPTAEQPWVAQRFVAGDEHCSFSLLVDGQLRAHACYRPLYRVGRGSGIYFQPVRPQAVQVFVEDFGRATGYTGQVGFDFIADAHGRFHVLECNPRATSGIHLFDDRPTALVNALNTPGEPLLPSPAPRMVALAMLLIGAPRHLASRRFWCDYRAARDVILRGGDLGPLAAQLLGVGEIAGRALRRRRGLLAASTADIEWDGQPLDGAPAP